MPMLRNCDRRFCPIKRQTVYQTKNGENENS